MQEIYNFQLPHDLCKIAKVWVQGEDTPEHRERLIADPNYQVYSEVYGPSRWSLGSYLEWRKGEHTVNSTGLYAFIPRIERSHERENKGWTKVFAGDHQPCVIDEDGGWSIKRTDKRKWEIKSLENDETYTFPTLWQCKVFARIEDGR